MKRQMRKMSPKGDEVVSEWDTETATPGELKQIEEEFNQKIKEGYFAADIAEGKNEIIKKFDPGAEILLIPRMAGGV